MARTRLTPIQEYNPYKVSAYLNSAQSTVNGWAQVNLNAVDFDTSGNFSTTNHQFTAPIAGFYHFDYSVNVNLTSATTLAAALSKNGAANRIWQGTEAAMAGAGYASVSGSNIAQLAAGDTIQLNVYAGVASCAITTGDITFLHVFFICAT